MVTRHGPPGRRLPLCLSDLPGHGGSPDEGCDQVSACAAIHELVDALDLAPVVIVGHSLGATTALLYAAIHAPRGVVSVDPVPLHLPHVADGLAPYVERMRSGDFDAAFLEWEERFDPPPHLRGSLRPRAVVALAYWKSLLSRADAEALQPLFAATLAGIAAPALVCLGQVPTADDAAILGTMRTASVEVHPGGHYLHLIDPERFATRIRSWLEELPS